MAMKTTPEALKVVTLGELLAHPFPHREHLLEPWLRQGESVMVWAGVGLGKTMLTLTMALAIAGGGEFLGWRNATPRKVLVVDGEMHAEDLKDRLALLMPTVVGLDVEAARANLNLMPRQFQSAHVEFPDLAAREGQDCIMAQVAKHGAELVILDNFATLADVEDENEAAAMSPVLAFLLRLKQTNVACILVHHSGKTGSTYRGSSKLATTFEVVLGLKANEDAVVGDGASFETEWTKFRGAPHQAVQAALVKLTAGAEGPRWVSTPAESDTIRTLLIHLHSGRYSTQKELADVMGVAEGTITKLKSKAIKAGRTTADEWRECLTVGYADRPDAAF